MSRTSALLLALIALACGGEPSFEPPAPAAAPATAPSSAPLEAVPAVEPAARAAAPAAAPLAPSDNLLVTSRARIAAGTIHDVDAGFRFGGTLCLVETPAQRPTIRVELAPGTRVTSIQLGAFQDPRARTFEVVADGEVLGTGEVGTDFAVSDRAVRILELHPAARGSSVCVTHIAVAGVAAPGAALGDRRAPPTSALPVLEPDETRLTLTGPAPLPAATPDRAAIAALAFAHGDHTITYELAVLRGRGDTTGAPLAPEASAEVGALPSIVPWTDPPAAIDPRYGEVCAGQRRRLVLSRRTSGSASADARPVDRTIAHVCGVASARMEASDLDGDGRLEIDLRVRGRDVGRALDRQWVVDAETFWTELEVADRELGAEVTRSADGTAYEIVRRSVVPDDRGAATSATTVRTVARYEAAIDSYVRGEGQTETAHAARAWADRDPSEHALLHAIRAALAGEGSTAQARAIGETRVPGSASMSTPELALAILDAAAPRAARAYQCVGYDEAAARIEGLGTIRDASDVGVTQQTAAEVAREIAHQCDCCGDCDATQAGQIACVAELANAPRDDAQWIERFAACAAALESVTSECPAQSAADTTWLWPLVLERARRAAGP